MKQIGKIALIFALSTAITACIGDSNASSGGNVEIQTLHKQQSTLSSISSGRVIEVFNTAYDYEVALSSYSVEDPIEVDFTQGQVVLVYYGMTPTQSTEIAVKSVKSSGEKAVVNIKIKRPGSGCGGNQAVGRPYEFVYVATTKKLIFKESMSVSGCG